MSFVRSPLLYSPSRHRRQPARILDLREAFDTNNHETLLFKLENYGVKSILEWFRSSLNDRTQCIANNDQYSKTLAIECGVIQGSVLRPQWFLIYVNDFPSSCDNIVPFWYANVTNCVYIRPKNPTSALQIKLSKYRHGWQKIN